MMKWHIDSWAVRDGLAFASQRPPEEHQKADRTVFVAVPSLDVIPVGRISTGLWATRANFQAGLHSENGEEIGFESLDEVKELIRRGYLAGGIGPGPGGEVGPEGPAPWRDGPDAGERYWEHELSLLEDAQHWFETSEGIGTKQIRDQLFAKLTNPKAIEGLFEYLRTYAESSLAMWGEELRRSAGNDEEAAQDFNLWLNLLIASSLWESLEAFERALVNTRTADLFEEDSWHYPPWWGGLSKWGRWATGTAGSEIAASESLIFRVPCPLRAGWDHDIRRLSDKVLLATSTIDYFDQNQGIAELIPSLLGALAIVAPSHGPVVRPSSGFRETRLKAAFDWLSGQMPQLRLPPPAEEALTRFAWSELKRTL
jgi:hypothetical protein